MHFVDLAASWALRLAGRRFAVFPDGLGDGDLGRLVERIPAPDDSIQPIELE